MARGGKRVAEIPTAADHVTPNSSITIGVSAVIVSHKGSRSIASPLFVSRGPICARFTVSSHVLAAAIVHSALHVLWCPLRVVECLIASGRRRVRAIDIVHLHATASLVTVVRAERQSRAVA
eukprot:30773-Pelagococcus_subviridis.AAC.2